MAKSPSGPLTPSQLRAVRAMRRLSRLSILPPDSDRQYMARAAFRRPLEKVTAKPHPDHVALSVLQAALRKRLPTVSDRRLSGFAQDVVGRVSTWREVVEPRTRPKGSPERRLENLEAAARRFSEAVAALDKGEWELFETVAGGRAAKGGGDGAEARIADVLTNAANALREDGKRAAATAGIVAGMRQSYRPLTSRKAANLLTLWLAESYAANFGHKPAWAADGMFRDILGIVFNATGLDNALIPHEKALRSIVASPSLWASPPAPRGRKQPR